MKRKEKNDGYVGDSFSFPTFLKNCLVADFFRGFFFFKMSEENQVGEITKGRRSQRMTKRGEKFLLSDR